MIPDGYNHFEQSRLLHVIAYIDMIDPDNPRKVTKCLLWESQENRDQEAVS